MRSFSHWSLNYLVNRAIEKNYRAKNPGLPWLTPQANRILTTLLLPGDVGLEFGSGRSTIWFSRRVKSLTSVEHNPEWFARVSKMLIEQDIQNVDYRLCKKEEIGVKKPKYIETVESINENSIDFVLVDGIYREDCVETVIPKLKPGGVLIIDNVNHYLPSHSKAPNSIPADQQPPNPIWEKEYKIIKFWRTIWTSNGVSDTAFFFKP